MSRTAQLGVWLACVVVASCPLAGCPGSTDADGGPPDMPSDAGPAPDADADADAGDAGRELGVDAGAPCSDEGRYLCTVPTRQCCGGVWIEYDDGPCYPRDGGGVPPDCSTGHAVEGCPCDADAGTVCGVISRLDCVGGVWTFNTLYGCCP